VLEARRRAKEAEAARAPVATPPHGLGLANALGPIPRPEWIRDLLDRQRAAAGITPVMGAARPSAAAEGVHTPLEQAATRAGTRGEKQPALSHIETGDKLPSAAELAKHSGEKASGGPR
jgi:hypothetical protein